LTAFFRPVAAWLMRLPGIRVSIWNPWRRIRQLEADAVFAERSIESLQRHCDLLADRYDKIRVTNEQLRGALDLYRDEHRSH